MSIAEINDVQWPAEQVAFMEDFYRQTDAIPGSKRRLWNGVVDLELGVCPGGGVIADCDVQATPKYVVEHSLGGQSLLPEEA